MHPVACCAMGLAAGTGGVSTVTPRGGRERSSSSFWLILPGFLILMISFLLRRQTNKNIPIIVSVVVESPPARVMIHDLC